MTNNQRVRAAVQSLCSGCAGHAAVILRPRTARAATAHPLHTASRVPVPQAVQGAPRLRRPLLGVEQRRGHIALGAQAGTRLRQVNYGPLSVPAAVHQVRHAGQVHGRRRSHRSRTAGVSGCSCAGSDVLWARGVYAD